MPSHRPENLLWSSSWSLCMLRLLNPMSQKTDCLHFWFSYLSILQIFYQSLWWTNSICWMTLGWEIIQEQIPADVEECPIPEGTTKKHPCHSSLQHGCVPLLFDECEMQQYAFLTFLCCENGELENSQMIRNSARNSMGDITPPVANCDQHCHPNCAGKQKTKRD